MGFVHLHNHTQYSIQDAVNKIDDCLGRVKELGQTACAITDHGVMYGAIQFYKKTKELGIKPIIGCEVYITDRDHKVPENASHAKYYHLILLAENNQGYQNLIKLCSLGFVEGFYKKPRIDHALLRQYHEGLICLSACIGGEVPKAILRGDIVGAQKIIQEHVDIFGPGNYFLELQDHGTREEQLVAQELYRLSKALKVPVVVTNDCHYTRAEDKSVHDTLLCIRSQRPGQNPVLLHDSSDSRRMTYSGDGYYIKSEDEMRELFPWCPEGIENTEKIAERCNVEFKFHETKMPAYDVPEEYDAYTYLRKLCLDGIPKRYPGQEAEIIPKMDYELGVIREMGFLEYILIVWDFINWGKTHGVPIGPGRGSAAGCIVAYLIGITDIDPLRYDLLFQRFLNPERVSMPDIDVDMCKKKRHLVVEYVRKKFGDSCVCQIVTFGTFAARQVIKDVGKCLGIPLRDLDAMAKMIPGEPGMTLEKARKESPDFDNAMANEKELYELAVSLEGLPRQTGTHAAGVVICDRDVSDYVPLTVGKDDDGVKVIQTQYNMVEVEELGLLKMDFLGLRTLTAIAEAETLIQKRYGIVPEIQENDPDVYKMIATGKTTGVFQLESNGMQDFMKDLKPTSIEDLIAGIALYRPGPMDFIPNFIAGKKEKSSIVYPCEQLRPILEPTYGCIVYQEQVMAIFRDLAGYSLGRSDIVRRAMSKKKASVLEAERKVFLYGDEKEGIAGCIKNGISEKTAIKIYEDMSDFAKYAFNKSHAAAYAVVSYKTAWLMCHYPTEYYAALMTSVIEDTKKVAGYASAAYSKGIHLRPVDIIQSETGFIVPEEHEILFGLRGIRGIGEESAEKFCCLREESGIVTYRDAVSLLLEADVSADGLVSLANAGAFTSFGHTRMEYALSIRDAASSMRKENKKRIPGQISLFEILEDTTPEIDVPKLGEYSFLERCELEKEACGIYVTAQPADGFRSCLVAIQKKYEHYVHGIIKKVKYYNCKTGTMAFLNVEIAGEIGDYVVFSDAFRKYGDLIREDAFLLMEIKEDNIVGEMISFLNFPVNVWIRVPDKKTALEQKHWLEQLVKEKKMDQGGRDALRIFVSKEEWCPVANGIFKEESFLEILREHFGAENVCILPVTKK